MITQEQFLKSEIEDMNLTLKNKAFVNLAKQVSNYVNQFNPESVIDYGCGTGVYSEVLRQDGFNIMAQDVWKTHRDYCKSQYQDLKVIARPKKADFMLFIEVAEHMTDSEIVEAIEAIQPETILFSSTPEHTENDESWGHINIKTDGEWIGFFDQLGYEMYESPKTPTIWAITFKKK